MPSSDDRARGCVSSSGADDGTACRTPSFIVGLLLLGLRLLLCLRLLLVLRLLLGLRRCWWRRRRLTLS